MITKICNKCKIEKPIETFSRDKTTRDGLQRKCKECDAEYSKNHKPERKAYNTEYSKNHKNKKAECDAEYRRINNKEIKIKKAKYYEIYKNKIKANVLKYRRDVRLEVIIHYSNGTMQCKYCGEKHIEFLEMDHINGGGRKHAKLTNNNLYVWLKKNNYPEGYQVLCSNCNWKKIKIAAKTRGKLGTTQQKQDHNRRLKLRLDVFSHYKTDDEIKCSCLNCNVDDIDLLCLDHINGDGTEHRKIVGSNIYRWVRDNNYPDTFRILCHNCNQSLNKYDYCPHDIK